VFVFFVDAPYLGLYFSGLGLNCIELVDYFDVDLYHTDLFIEGAQLVGQCFVVGEIAVGDPVDVLLAVFLGRPPGLSLVEIFVHHELALEDHESDGRGCDYFGLAVVEFVEIVRIVDVLLLFLHHLVRLSPLLTLLKHILAYTFLYFYFLGSSLCSDVPKLLIVQYLLVEFALPDTLGVKTIMQTFYVIKMDGGPPSGVVLFPVYSLILLAYEPVEISIAVLSQ
jgi:hypothetical protein